MAANQQGDLGSKIRLGAIVVVLVILIVFIAVNFDEVDIDLLVAQPSLPLAFALIIAAVLGFGAGYFAPHRR